MKNWLVFGSLWFTFFIESGICGTFAFQFDPNEVSFASEKGRVSRGPHAVSSFLHEAESLVPPSIKEKLARPILIRFKKLDENLELPIPICSEDSSPRSEEHIHKSGKTIYGKTHSHEIWINSLFLPHILNGSDQADPVFPCRHKNFYRLALATVLHEVAHLYDFSKPLTWKGIVSSDLKYQKLAGWNHHKLFSHLFTSRVAPSNEAKLRSPDLYEYSDIREYFAVNMEYFLLDPEYGCRRPTEHTFFVKHFGFNPYPNPGCQINTKVNFHFLNANLETNPIADLDPKRVYEIHYLLAKKGASPGGHFGHSMFRFILCDPKRTEVGPECLKDVGHHAVLSFRALSTHARLDPWKALTGQYSSQGFLFYFPDILEEYNKFELRDVASIPIRFSPEEKATFIYKFLETYWEYRGRYYFLKNNCSTESARMLKIALERPRGFRALFQSPNGLLDQLEDGGWVDTAVLKDQAAAIKAGYFFPSAKDLQEKAFETVRSGSKLVSENWSTWERFMTESHPRDRRRIFLGMLKGQKKANPTEIRKVTAAYYYLESSLFRLKERRFEEMAFQKLEEDRKENVATEVSTLYTEVVNSAKESFGVSSQDFGYGIPIEGSLEQVSDVVSEETETSSNSEDACPMPEPYVQELKKWMEKTFPEQKAELADIRANLILFREKMRTFHHE